MAQLIRKTRSVCPRCLKNIPALLTREGRTVYMEKTCPEHGSFRAPVWRGLADFDDWRGGEPELLPGEGERCPADCGICPEDRAAAACCWR